MILMRGAKSSPGLQGTRARGCKESAAAAAQVGPSSIRRYWALGSIRNGKSPSHATPFPGRDGRNGTCKNHEFRTKLLTLKNLTIFCAKDMHNSEVLS